MIVENTCHECGSELQVVNRPSEVSNFLELNNDDLGEDEASHVHVSAICWNTYTVVERSQTFSHTVSLDLVIPHSVFSNGTSFFNTKSFVGCFLDGNGVNIIER